MNLIEMEFIIRNLKAEQERLLASASPEVVEEFQELKAYHASLPVLTIDYDGGPILNGVKVQPCKV